MVNSKYSSTGILRVLFVFLLLLLLLALQPSSREVNSSGVEKLWVRRNTSKYSIWQGSRETKNETKSQFHGPQAELKLKAYPDKMSSEDFRTSYRHFCFNSWKSDSIELNRVIPDVRKSECRSKYSNLQNLPKASIIIIFYNELLSVLLRSVVSILNRTPKNLLNEIILVDDFSNYTFAPWLRDELPQFVMNISKKVTLVRLNERHGLMRARMAGAEVRSENDDEVLIFLDSHIEVAPHWIEPLLFRISENRQSVVVPAIDSIDHESLVYSPGGIGVLGFSWKLGQEFLSVPETYVDVSASPIMAGGLFGIDKAWWRQIEGYDPELQLYGGEEMEIGFKVWTCGGRIEVISCSHVGHIFRSPKYWQGQVYEVPGEVITRNKLRVARVWMDEYVRLAELSFPPMKDVGDLTRQQELRKKLQCRPFSWFLKNVFPTAFIPNITTSSKTGYIKLADTETCMDTMGSTREKPVPGGWYSCHYGHGTQSFVLTEDGKLRVAEWNYRGVVCPKKTKLRRDPELIVQDETTCAKKWTWEYDETSKKLILSGELCLGKCKSKWCLEDCDLAEDEENFAIIFGG